ncbi:MAG: hypothetical protein F6K31_11105 [Symploca sp. SIO2G7]|nr:hypothetical protein [Symploca sp. SIO2G7]
MELASVSVRSLSLALWVKCDRLMLDFKIPDFLVQTVINKGKPVEEVGDLSPEMGRIGSNSARAQDLRLLGSNCN